MNVHTTTEILSSDDIIKLYHSNIICVHKVYFLELHTILIILRGSLNKVLY